MLLPQRRDARRAAARIRERTGAAAREAGQKSKEMRVAKSKERTEDRDIIYLLSVWLVWHGLALPSLAHPFPSKRPRQAATFRRATVKWSAGGGWPAADDELGCCLSGRPFHASLIVVIVRPAE